MDHPQFELRLPEPQIAEVILRPGVYLDVALADSVDEALKKLAPDRKFYQLVIISEPYIVNPELRHSFSKGGASTRQLAIAFVNRNEAENVRESEIAATINIPVPLGFFTDRGKALEWLRGLAASAK
jgi:hypothetical protein